MRATLITPGGPAAPNVPVGWFSFVGLAIGLELVSVVLLLLWMKRHGWSR